MNQRRWEDWLGSMWLDADVVKDCDKRRRVRKNKKETREENEEEGSSYNRQTIDTERNIEEAVSIDGICEQI